MYYSEIGQIIEAGLERDADKVRNYAILLAKKMEEDGEKRGSERIINVIEKKNSRKASLDSLTPLPVDQESRLNIVDICYHPESINLILSESVQLKLFDFIETLQRKNEMYEKGLDFSQSLLLYGYPGCGKTSVASFIASKMKLPLVTAKLDSLISSLLGATAKNIHKVFEYAKRQPCVLFLDEFDAIAKARDDQHELGELKRVVNSLLQNIDDYCQDGILVAATNHHELLDNAIWRRFHTVIEMPRPGIPEIREMMKMFPEYIVVDSIKKNQWDKIYLSMLGLSYSDIRILINNISKKAVFSKNYSLTFESIVAEIFIFKNHGDCTKENVSSFMLKNGVAKKQVEAYTGLSRRKVDQIAERIDRNE